jgi:hypothetical protein
MGESRFLCRRRRRDRFGQDTCGGQHGLPHRALDPGDPKSGVLNQTMEGFDADSLRTAVPWQPQLYCLRNFAEDLMLKLFATEKKVFVSATLRQ